jgi:oxygen-independent coproporphyrinogen-3 oxidase
MPAFNELPPLSLYIHIPWCVRKCPYCDFNSHEGKENFSESAYIDTLLTDLEQQLASVWGRRLVSVFIGGGTPSLFSPQSIDRLISGLRARMQYLANMEITMEANPGTFERDKFSEFRDAGINRLSIGIQSFDADKLQALGRIHNGREAIAAVETAQQAGFDNINLDIMFGLPQQTAVQGLKDLRTAIELQPAHISWYQLTIEPNTLFHSRPPAMPEDEAIWELQQQGQDLLARHGYLQYEISAYGQKHRQCRHNLNYWEFGDYLAIGAGAHGKITSSQTQRVERYWKLRQPRTYMDSPDKTAGRRELSRDDLIFEFMLNALRLKQGVSRQLFEQRTGIDFTEIGEICQQARNRGLLQRDDDRLAASAQGYLFLNDLINLFHLETTD